MILKIEVKFVEGATKKEQKELLKNIKQSLQFHFDNSYEYTPENGVYSIKFLKG